MGIVYVVGGLVGFIVTLFAAKYILGLDEIARNQRELNHDVEAIKKLLEKLGQ